ncbi:MAG: hypothetical protein ABEK36_01190, partial [Candidatus Aenigmatarchaeota archaeon]
MKHKIILTFLASLLFFGIFSASGMAWLNSSWNYQRQLNRTNDNSYNFQYTGHNFTIDTATLISNGKMQSDCDDIRIVYGDSITDYDVENCNSANTWIVFRANTSASSTQTNSYIYYGNPSATNAENEDWYIHTDATDGSYTSDWTNRDTTGTYNSGEDGTSTNGYNYSDMFWMHHEGSTANGNDRSTRDDAILDLSSIQSNVFSFRGRWDTERDDYGIGCDINPAAIYITSSTAEGESEWDDGNVWEISSTDWNSPSIHDETSFNLRKYNSTAVVVNSTSQVFHGCEPSSQSYINRLINPGSPQYLIIGSKMYDAGGTCYQETGIGSILEVPALNGPVVSVGSEQTQNSAPSISINNPDNTTYFDYDIPVDVNTSDPDGDAYSCNISDDGTVIATTDETSETYSTTLTKSDGNHQLSVSCEDNNTATSSDSVSYTVDTTAPSITIEKPTESYERTEVPVNYTTNDATSSVDKCWYSIDSGANNTIAGCSNTSVSTGTVGEHNLTLYANDTVGNVESETNTFDTYHENEIRVEDSATSSSIDSFEVIFDNGTDTFGGSMDTGKFLFNTSEVPYGSTNVTLRSSGYNTEEFSLGTVNDSFDLNTTYQLETAEISISVKDEETENNIDYNMTVSNGTEEMDFLNENKTIINSGWNCDGSESWAKVYTFNYGLAGVFADEITYSVDTVNDEGDVRISVFYGDGTNQTDFCQKTVNTGESFSKTCNLNSDIPVEYVEFWIKDGGTYADVFGLAVNSITLTNNKDTDVTTSYNSWKNVSLPTGDLTFSFESKDYKPRMYYSTFEGFNTLNLQTYLLKDTDAITQTIVVVNEQGEGVKNAQITIQKKYDGVWKTVSQKLSTGSGTNFFLNSETQYKLIVSKTGYVQAEDTFYPQSFQDITVQLGQPSEFNFETIMDRISQRLEPEGNTLPASKVYLNYSVYDSENSLEEVGL